MKFFDELSLNNIEKLKEIESLFFYLLKTTPDYIFIKDKEHKFLYASDTVAKNCGFEEGSQLAGKTDFELFPEEFAKIYYTEEKKVLEKGKNLTAREEPYIRDGKVCYVSTTKSPIFDEEGNIVGVFAICRDITNKKKLEEDLQKHADFDTLTKLYNRRMFFEQSKKLLELCKRECKEAVLYFIDLDDFKDINDNYGHDAGDEVLKVIANRLKENFRASDVISRFGGDEFLIFTISQNEEQVHESIKNEIAQIISKKIEFKYNSFFVKCSIGISIFPEDGKDIEKLISTADLRMYEEKKTHHSIR